MSICRCVCACVCYIHMCVLSFGWVDKTQHILFIWRTCVSAFISMCHKKECILVSPENSSSCATRRHVILCRKKTCLLVPKEDMSYCVTGRQVFLCHKTTCLLVQQQEMSCVMLCKNTCLLAAQEETTIEESHNLYTMYFWICEDMQS